ncbi:hypothetical protein F4820DRAFT_431226 [Hypoxylon rubiginosum]|uniref:Uncharacterized protein n=1 Tax=Hypoxylon rubiginosum TaxID=110542 RepID=A0ACB9YT87_9PEZI|nr:hypothetical protein F4820DRAFT_431226 [Hypoxylon rubiginosum]
MGTAKPSSLSQQHSPEHHNPFGLRRLAFGALIALVTALIVGAAMGGGLGSAITKKEECDTSPLVVTSTESFLIPASTSAPTASTSAASTALVNYAAPEPSLVQTLDDNCPKLNNTILEDTNADQYRVTCGYRVLGNPSITTWSALVAYSLQDCV